MNCYLCDSSLIEKVDGTVRDKPEISVLKCMDCHLVFLDSFDHIRENFYEESKMRGREETIEEWKKNTLVDDKRRFEALKGAMSNKDVMDFGAGNGGFLALSKVCAKSVTAVELDKEAHEVYKREEISFYTNLDNIPSDKKFDIITAFHVIEHLKDPIGYLREVSKYLKNDGKIFLEFPNSEDCLLSLYKSKDFSKFTYWSCHLMLFNEDNIKKVIKKAELKCSNIEQIQRYPLSNHLYWLSHGQPGGHKKWPLFNVEEINKEYEKILSNIGACDTLLVEVTKRIR